MCVCICRLTVGASSNAISVITGSSDNDSWAVKNNQHSSSYVFLVHSIYGFPLSPSFMVFPPPLPYLSTHIITILHISLLSFWFWLLFLLFFPALFFNLHLFIFSFPFVSLPGLNLEHFPSCLLLFSLLEYHKQEKVNLIVIPLLQLWYHAIFAGYISANVDIISPGKVTLIIHSLRCLMCWNDGLKS